MEVKMLAPIIEIFCEIDDFCKQFLKNQQTKILPNPNRKRRRKCQMSISEIMTIVILFHLSHYRTFKDFYHECVIRYLQSYFPNLVSYNRFVELQAIVIAPLTAYLLSKRGQETGLYYVDSTPLKVCHNRRIYKHKVFKGIANRGKHSMGWFFGFKTGKSGFMFGNYFRLKIAISIPWNIDRELIVIGFYSFFAVAITRISTIITLIIMLIISKLSAHFCF
jgi:hypothetical protein